MIKHIKLYIVLLIITIPIFSQDLTIIKNDTWKKYNLKFEPLTENEILTFRYGNISINGEEFTFHLYRYNTQSKEEILIGRWHTGWAYYQFSEDLKKGLFFLQAKGRNRPLFLIDGEKGSISYLMDINLTTRSNLKFDHLLFTDYTYENNEVYFYLYDIKKELIISTTQWKIKNIKAGSWLSIYRNLDGFYDFNIEFGADNDLIANAYFTDAIIINFDYSDQSYKSYLETKKHTLEELGIIVPIGKE